MAAFHKIAFVSSIALSLSACGATTPPPAVELKIQRVEVPVPVICLTAKQYQDLIAGEPAKVSAQLNGQAAHDLDVVAASALRLRAYVGELQAALKACSAG